MSKRNNPDIDSERSTRRIINFSDGVFAVAITLLVVQLPIPIKASDHELDDDLLANMSMYISYAISFGVIALLWLKHLHFNNHLKRYSVGLIWLNFFFLFVIAFLPFPTAVYGTHGDDMVAQIFYAATISMAGYLSGLMWVIAIRHGELMYAEIDYDEARHSRFVAFIMPTGFAISILFSFISTSIVPYIWMAFAAVSPLIRKL